MTDFERVLMNRDGMTREEAKAEKRRAREEVMSYFDDNMSYDDIEDMFCGEYGLETDYLLDLLL